MYGSVEMILSGDGRNLKLHLNIANTNRQSLPKMPHGKCESIERSIDKGNLRKPDVCARSSKC